MSVNGTPLARLGGRKFVGFLLLVAVVILFVMAGKITSESIIRDLLLGLFAIVSGFNVLQKWAAPNAAQPSAASTPKETAS